MHPRPFINLFKLTLLEGDILDVNGYLPCFSLCCALAGSESSITAGNSCHRAVGTGAGSMWLMSDLLLFTDSLDPGVLVPDSVLFHFLRQFVCFYFFFPLGFYSIYW